MKLLMLNYEYPPVGGGGGVIHQQVAEQLARRHDVTVVTSAFGDLPLREMVRGVDVRRVKVMGRTCLAKASLISLLSFHPACIREGQRIIDGDRPDLLVTHFAVPTGPAGVVLARRNKLPHVLCIHGGDIYDPSKFLSPHRTPGLWHAVRHVLRNVDRVVAQSENTAQNARRIYQVDRPCTIIPHGIQSPSLPPFDRQELGLPADHVVLVTVGRLVRRKANEQLVRILGELRERHVTLVIIGDGPERPRLEALAQQLGVAERVVLAGYVDEARKLQYLQAADIFVSTTQHEGFGLMYLEAMLCGLPIVTYDHGGQSDFLEDGNTGYLVPLNDYRLFRERVEQLVADASLRERTGDYSRGLFEEFRVEKCAARFEGLFEQLSGAKRGVHAMCSLN